MESTELLPILIGIAVIVIVFFSIKRIASCLIKTIIMLLVAGALAFVYFNYIKKYDDGEKKPAIVRQVDKQLHTAR